MAIQVGGITVINNSQKLQNVTGLKTVNGSSILGSGNITAGGISSAVDFSSSTSGSFYASQSTSDWNTISIPSGSTFFVVRALPGTQSSRGSKTVRININGLSNLTLATNISGDDNRPGIAAVWVFDIGSGSYANYDSNGSVAQRSTAITSITMARRRQETLGSTIMDLTISTLVNVERLVPSERPMEWLVNIYLYALSHCSWRDAVDSLPAIEVVPADHYFIICDGHHRFECLKRLGAKRVKIYEQKE